MSLGTFLYRQNQKIKSRWSEDATLKKIHTINFKSKRIIIEDKYYHLLELELRIPKERFDFIFAHYDSLVVSKNFLDGKLIIDASRLVFCFSKYKIGIQSSSDIIIIEEVYCKNIYGLKFHEKNSILAIDIGMNTGLSCLFFANNKAIERVIGYEPFYEPFENAKFNFELNQDLKEKISPINAAISSQEGNKTVGFNNENLAISSIHSNINQEKTEQILLLEAKKEISKILSENKQYETVLIKMDCEGSEFEIFDSAFGESVDNRIRYFIIEWHDKEPCNIEIILNANNFTYLKTYIKKDLGMIYAFRK